jgi:hypothetical protein
MFTDVPEEHIAFIFRVKEEAKQVARRKQPASLKMEAGSSFAVNLYWTACHYFLE